MFRRHISRQLAAYHDGQLTAEERQRADLHLGACPRCRIELDQMRFTAAMLEGLPIVQAPDSIRRSQATQRIIMSAGFSCFIPYFIANRNSARQ